MRKTKTKTPTGGIHGVTIAHRVGQKVINETFVKKLRVKSEGENSYVDNFLTIGERILNSGRRTFDLDTFLYECKPYSIPTLIIREYYDKFVQALQTWNRIELVDGCYNEPIAVLV